MANEQYLTTALAWLRLRLARLAEHTRALQGPAGLVDEAELADAAATMADAEAMEPPPALCILGQCFGLSRFEREVLLLCAAMELDTRIADLCARAQGDASRRYPTFALAFTLFDEPAWDALSPERPLRYWQLIEIRPTDTEPLTTCPLCVDERIGSYIKGLNYLDDRLTPLLAPLSLSDAEAELPPSQKAIVETIVGHVQQPARAPRLPVIQLLGSDSDSKQLVAWHTATALGLFLYRLPVELLPRNPVDLETFARLWQRETMLLPVALYLDAHATDESSDNDGPASTVTRFLARSDGLFFFDARDVWPNLGQATLDIDVAKPTPIEQQTAWAAALGGVSATSPALLTGQFNLGIASIAEIAAAFLAGPQPDGRRVDDLLWDACLVRTRPRLDTLAQRLEPKATWDHIVLLDDALDLLRQIADQVRRRSQVYEDWGFRQYMNRGMGIVALFAGESGTGKTMAAEIIANELRLNLYRIDLSAVVSKYIGETEKNLRRLFDAAEDGGAILFFDEADALFGKRSQVRDSHDRYANIEVNYLLQRMEAYRGLAILATNMKSSLDEAFTRRIRFIVNFPVPEHRDRKRIWQKVFPPETPVGELDFDRLARYKLTGGGVFNSALNAAFLAAQEGTAVTMAHVLKAIRTEFLKSDRLIHESEFAWGEPAQGNVAR